MKDIEFTYKNALIGWDKTSETANSISNYISHIKKVSENGYSDAESSINLPFDLVMLEEIKNVAEKVRTDNLKYIIVVGIGGSNLGAKAVYDAVRGTLDAFLTEQTPKIIFVDTVDPKLLKNINIILNEYVFNPEEIFINIISKSGTTTETIANFEAIHSLLKNRFSDIKDRVVVTTDRDSKLWNQAVKNGFKTLTIPEMIGGRYSVFSSVGLFPIALAGIDISALLEGARIMRDRCIKEDISENPALAFAILLYLHNQNGIAIHNSFFFNPEFESVGKWYRQLMAESTGKMYGVDDKEINAGITPTVSIGSTDLHSMAQLYLGGPKDKFTTFIYASGNSTKEAVPSELLFHGLVEGIERKEFSKIMKSVLEGVKEAYKKNGLPFAEIKMSDTSEHSIGQFLQFKMIKIMYLAHLMGVNSFNQPAVEDYKKETRRILIEGV
jgi:glucose-6-phosphate isomerase